LIDPWRAQTAQATAIGPKLHARKFTDVPDALVDAMSNMRLKVAACCGISS
jgi:hypothetical protein